MSIKYLDSPQGPGYNGCTCSCHNTTAKVYHFRACCPAQPRGQLLDLVQEINEDRAVEFDFRMGETADEERSN